LASADAVNKTKRGSPADAFKLTSLVPDQQFGVVGKVILGCGGKHKRDTVWMNLSDKLQGALIKWIEHIRRVGRWGSSIDNLQVGKVGKRSVAQRHGARPRFRPANVLELKSPLDQRVLQLVEPKAPSPLRSAGALQKLVVWIADFC
jgi:hypothetical protein